MKDLYIRSITDDGRGVSVILYLTHVYKKQISVCFNLLFHWLNLG